MAVNTINGSDDLLEALSSGVMILDMNCVVQYMNQAAEVMLGFSKLRALGVAIQQIIPTPAFYQPLQLAAASHQAQTIRECVIDRVGQGAITVDCVITPVHEPAGALLLEFNHIDRQLRIFREQQQLNQQQAIYELVRGIAHEVKNPLSGLRGAAQLLESELASDELREYTQVIIAEADRLKALVDNLLGSGQLPKPEDVNIHEVLEYVCQLVSKSHDSRITFVRDYDPSAPECRVDRGHLVQVCLNIINNAMRATQYQGTVWLRTRILRQFTINERRYRLVLKVDICDDGEGIPPALRDKLFLPMVSGHADGTGLGLAIAQSLMRQYGGMIYCEDEEQTCFSILLPYQQEDN